MKRNGGTQEQTAICLNISPRTVSNHLQSIYDKTGVRRNQIGAVMLLLAAEASHPSISAG